MPPKATTFRIDPPVQAALEMLSKTLKRPMNQLVNEAVRAYVARRSAEVARDLEATLARLRAYREQDPDFEDAIEQVANAEAQLGQDDPTEGEIVIGTLIDGRLIEETPGPVQAEIDRLLHG
jgi:predicted transcriptional regulator